jgi:allantoate deiminase
MTPRSDNGMGAEILHRVARLAEITEVPGQLTRGYLTDEHRRANELVMRWMHEAGMASRVDAVGNVVGIYEGTDPTLPALMFGSHLDTVGNAGWYDGILGVVLPIVCTEHLARQGKRMTFPVAVVGFANEEGLRFQPPFTGSRAIAGTLDPSVLERTDAQGTSLTRAMSDFGLDPSATGTAAWRSQDILAYAEVHIEQGPVLEEKGLPLGVVTSIAGASRFEVDLTGQAGHAGTVPMALRRDALAAAAECITAVERICGARRNVVATVGRVEALPGAINVIPGDARFTIDIRAALDKSRVAVEKEVTEELAAICARREIAISITQTHRHSSCACSPELTALWATAVAGQGIEVLELFSGAGHDAMMFADIARIGMLFVRCKGGISHNPQESITEADTEAAARTLLSFISLVEPRRFSAKP